MDEPIEKGNPVLYLASNPNTAMAEMRPWVGSRVTLAKFVMTRDCRVVDCFHNTTESWNFEPIGAPGEVTVEPDAQTIGLGVWGDIGMAFSRPVASDQIIEYVPTQLLARELKQEGYDGIAYKSLLVGGGINIVLFDVGAAKQAPNRSLYETRCVSYEFARTGGSAPWCDATVVSRYRHEVSGSA